MLSNEQKMEFYFLFPFFLKFKIGYIEKLNM